MTDLVSAVRAVHQLPFFHSNKLQCVALKSRDSSCIQDAFPWMMSLFLSLSTAVSTVNYRFTVVLGLHLGYVYVLCTSFSRRGGSRGFVGFR